MVVNGAVVAKDSKVLDDVNRGQSIRFDPISIENWTQQYAVAPVEFGGAVPYCQRR